MAPENSEILKTEELTELLRGIRERVRARYPDANGAGACRRCRSHFAGSRP